MKVYGNSKGDGFAILCTLVAGVFVLGGLGLSFVGGVMLPIGVVAIAVLFAVMVGGLKRWEVMSEVDAIDVTKPIPGAAVFGMPATSDVAVAPVKGAWSPSIGHDANLPAKVDAPKPAVETNTPVA